MSAEVFTAITTKELGVSKNPVGQQATIADATTQNISGEDNIDIVKVAADITSCKNAINAIIDRLKAFGFIE